MSRVVRHNVTKLVTKTHTSSIPASRSAPRIPSRLAGKILWLDFARAIYSGEVNFYIPLVAHVEYISPESLTRDDRRIYAAPFMKNRRHADDVESTA